MPLYRYPKENAVPVQRNWTILEQPLVVRDDEPDQLHEAVLEVLAILRRVGGTIQIASQRVEIAPNVGVTESFVFAYNSFTPIVRRVGEEEQDEHLEHLEDDRELTEELADHFPPGALENALQDVADAEQPAAPAPTPAME
jgi:hypothetical protein